MLLKKIFISCTKVRNDIVEKYETRPTVKSENGFKRNFKILNTK